MIYSKKRLENAHVLQKMGTSRADQEMAGGERFNTDPLAPLREPGPQLKDTLRSKFRDLDMQVQGCQKATQRARKM